MGKPNPKRWCPYCGKERLGFWDRPHEDTDGKCPKVLVSVVTNGRIVFYELKEPIDSE